MMLNEWLKKNNISSKEKIFCYTAWYNFQASKRHKKNLQIVNPKQIKIFDSTLEKQITECMKNKDMDLFKILSIEDENLNLFGHDVSDLPSHLQLDYAKETGWRKQICRKLDIDYSVFCLDLSLLNGLKFQDYSIYFPKNSEEVVIGGLAMHNCMGTSGDYCVAEFMKDPIKYQNDYHYIDAHILKENKLVGVFAIEEILHIKNHGKPKKSLFVNTSNSTNIEMECILLDLIKEKYGIESLAYTNKWENSQPLRTHSSFYPWDLSQKINIAIQILKSKLEP